MHPTAALFSPIIAYSYNDGATWTNLDVAANIRYSHGIAELGQSGVSVARLTFETLQGHIDLNASIRIKVAGYSDFWVNSRSLSHGIISVECLDTAAFLDCDIDTADAEAQTALLPEDQQCMDIDDFEDQITAQCKGLSVHNLPSFSQYGIPINLIKGKTFQQFFTDCSQAMGGFYAAYNGSLYLYTPQSVATGDTVEDYSYLDIQGTYTVSNVLVHADEDYTIPANAAIDSHTMTVDGCFADYADTTVLNTYVNKTFQAWRCDNVKLHTIPKIGDTIRFIHGNTHTDLRVTSIDIRWVGGTMIGTLAGTIPQSGEIARRTRFLAKVEEKVEEAKTYNNMMITPYQGIIYLEESGGNA